MARPFLRLQLALLGPPVARLGDRVLKFPTRKTLALLAYLATEPGEQPREQLAALLWPEASAERAHASLRNTLGHLQAALRPASGEAQISYLSVSRGTLGLKLEAGVEIDLQTVEQAYRLARAERSGRAQPAGSASLSLLKAAAACYRGDFLSGFSLGDAPGFDDWVGTQREAWRRSTGLILDRLSEIQYAAGDFAGTAETAARWIGLDGLNERAYRRKMRAHFAAGERGQALETYAACQAILAAELQAQPEPDTEALAEHIRSQQRPAAVVLDAPATPVSYLDSKFAGRAAELQRLMDQYRQAAQGQLQVVIVSGEAGIGKTRLAVEFLAWCRANGAEVLRGSAFESGSHMPFQPLVEALRARLTQLPYLPAGPPPAGLESLARLLPELRERYPGLAALPADLALSQTQLFEPLARLIVDLAGPAPLVLFLDDLQWADSATLEMLQYAIRRWQAGAAPVLLLLALRSEALQPATRRQPASLAEWLAQVERQLPVARVPLAALGQAATVQWVRSLLVPPADDFAQWVFDETHGQPFYLMETLKDLLERGVLRSQRQPDGAWGFQVNAEHDLGRAALVPSTVRAVIRARLDRLSPPAAELLAAAAVLEHDLSFDRLCQVANVSEDLGLPALDELISSRLLRDMPRAGAASQYSFANDMLRDVVYTEAGDARRRLFHRRALEGLALAKAPAAVLAHHALAAGQSEAAVRHSLLAGQEALRLSAADEARAHLEQARHLAQQEPQVKAEFEAHIRTLYTQLARAYELNGQPEQATAVYAEMERLASRA